MEDQKPTEICCCPAYSWTKVIAWIQIIYYSIPTALLAVVLILFMNDPTNFVSAWNERHEYSEKFSLGEEDPYIKIILKLHPMVVLLILGIVLIPNIAVGILLLIAANKKSVKYLTIWTIYGVVCMIMQVCQVTLGTPVYIFGSLVAIGVYGFQIYVVQKFRREIESGLYGENGRIINYKIPPTNGNFNYFDQEKNSLNKV